MAACFRNCITGTNLQPRIPMTFFYPVPRPNLPIQAQVVQHRRLHGTIEFHLSQLIAVVSRKTRFPGVFFRFSIGSRVLLSWVCLEKDVVVGIPSGLLPKEITPTTINAHAFEHEIILKKAEKKHQPCNKNHPQTYQQIYTVYIYIYL